MLLFVSISAFADDSPAPLDYSKPLFSKNGAPMCNSRDDLATLLGLVRTGQKELASHVQGCTPLPDGVPMVELDREGIVEVWLRVRVMVGAQPTAWIPAWTLRNDDSPAITGDPAVGKARVCITKSFDHAHVPALAIFTNGGQLVGDLRDDWSQDTFKADTLNNHAALITTQPFDLSKEAPCADVSARMFVQDGFKITTWNATSNNVWDFDHVLGYPIRKLPQPNELETLLGRIGLRAIVVADIGNPLSTSEEDAAQNEPENPLNQIPADMEESGKTAMAGPGGKGNFQVCLSKDMGDIPAFNGVPAVTIPKDTIFESGGKLIGDLRSPEPDLDYAEHDNKTAFAVIMLKGATVSKRSPCSVVTVRSIIANSSAWIYPLVRASRHLHFQALNVRGVDDASKLPGHIDDAIISGILNGTPVADIGRPLDLGDDNP